MLNLLKGFLTDMFYQVFGLQKPRSGMLILTMYAHKRMEEHQLDFDTIEDTFRYGDEVRDKMIVRRYANNSVGLVYRIDEPKRLGQIEEQYVIITCWKRPNWHP
jgi:hypothetical protein